MYQNNHYNMTYNKYSRSILSSILAAFLMAITIGLLSSPTHARTNLVLGELAPLPPKKESSIKAMLARITKKKRDKPRGLADPKKPVVIKYDPVLARLPEKYQLPEQFIVVENRLDLRCLTPEVLIDLTGLEIEALVKYLAQIDVKIELEDKKSAAKSDIDQKPSRLSQLFWNKSNAAAAIALDLATRNEYELFAAFVTAAPDAIIPELKGHTFALLDQDALSIVIEALLVELGDGNTASISRSIASVAHLYLQYWAGSDPEKLALRLKHLLEDLRPRLMLVDGFYKEQRAGVLVGSLLAGAYKHIERIKENELKKLVIINSISNLAWAATGFLSAVPLVGAAVGGLAGGLSLGVVGWAVIHNIRSLKQDYIGLIHGLVGELKAKMLEIAVKKKEKYKLNTLMTMAFIHTAIRVNNFND